MIRLLNIQTREFKEFYDLDSAPDYAILSHRWIHAQRNGKQRALDVSYAEFIAGTGDQRGYEKIDKACEAVCDLAKQLGLDLNWIWIDSCCIEKNNNEEHTESINSMFEWYARSYVCIAYLEDVNPFEETSPSEWFKRGWTLQELIAPERVLFYNKDWIGCGSRNLYDPGSYGKHSFEDRSNVIATITRIDVTLLKLTNRKAIKRRLHAIPACQKMSWASDRKTTKDEDVAYCLIGIFDIPHMYLKRGEGRRAFIRLQEEIIRQSNDLTLFAWALSGANDDVCIDDNCLAYEELVQDADPTAPFFASTSKSDLHGVFACGPCHFRHASTIEPTQLVVYNEELTITSRGVRLNTPLLGSGPFAPFKMPLYCTYEGTSALLSIELRLLGSSIFARTNCTQLPQLSKDAKVNPNQDDVFLANSVHRFQACAGQMHKHAIRLPSWILGLYRRTKVSPGYLWSSKYDLLITNGRRFFVGSASYQLDGSNAEVTLLFGLDHLQRPWFCLSNVDKSFEPSILESRKSYLERVWRHASQHGKTAHLDESKPFSIPGFEGINTGSMEVSSRLHTGHPIFEVEFESRSRFQHLYRRPDERMDERTEYTYTAVGQTANMGPDPFFDIAFDSRFTPLEASIPLNDSFELFPANTYQSAGPHDVTGRYQPGELILPPADTLGDFANYKAITLPDFEEYLGLAPSDYRSLPAGSKNGVQDTELGPKADNTPALRRSRRIRESALHRSEETVSEEQNKERSTRKRKQHDGGSSGSPPTKIRIAVKV